jgi:hypothetical protein
MSCTTLYAVWPHSGGTFEEVGEYRNSYGSAIFVWSALFKAYRQHIIGRQALAGEFPGCPGAIGHFDTYPLLWKYAAGKFDDLPELPSYDPRPQDTGFRPWETNTLLSTYDNAVLPRNGMLVMAQSFERFAYIYHAGDQRTHVCSLREQAATLREIYERGAVAAAWCQTSTSDFWGSGTYDEETEEHTPYSIETGKDHWMIEVLELDQMPKVT